MTATAEKIRKHREQRIPRSIARRYEVRQGTPPSPIDRGFLGTFSRCFPRLEFIYDPLLERWLLYELDFAGGARSDDKLLLRMVLQNPIEPKPLEPTRPREPGWWVADYLRDPANSFDGVEAHNQKIRDDLEARRIELAEDFGVTAETYLDKHRILSGTSDGPARVGKGYNGKRTNAKLTVLNVKTGQEQTRRVAI